MKRYAFTLAAWILIAGMAACSRHASTQDGARSASQALYHCAMHPQIVSDHPGECPICHMRLTLVDGAGTGEQTSSKKILYYRHPMNPAVTSPVPMKDEMGMDYIPVVADQTQRAVPVPGQAIVHLAPGIEQQIGVTVAT